MRTTISMVSEKYGASPSTIRSWERRRLIQLDRDWAGRRIFDEKAFKRIQELMNRSERRLPDAESL